LIVGIDNFDEKGFRSKIIPLGMDVMIVNRLGEVELAVLPPEKRGTFIGFGSVIQSPGVMRLNGMHGSLINHGFNKTTHPSGQWLYNKAPGDVPVEIPVILILHNF
jgi:hypothetical protein